jgi:hypothetical protein
MKRLGPAGSRAVGLLSNVVQARRSIADQVRDAIDRNDTARRSRLHASPGDPPPRDAR